MEYKVIQIDAQTWRIEDTTVRFFLLVGNKRALLVDSGKTVSNAREIAESLTDLPITLINTHTDSDHTVCNHQFDTVLMNPAEYMYYKKVQNRKGKLEPVWDGDIIELGDRPIEVITVPGHTPGSIALLDINNRVLIGGDGIQNGRIFLFGPQRELEAYLYSLKKIERLETRFDFVYPSHSQFPAAENTVKRLIAGVERILRGEVSSTPSEFMGTPIKEYDIGVATILYDADINMP